MEEREREERTEKTKEGERRGSQEGNLVVLHTGWTKSGWVGPQSLFLNSLTRQRSETPQQ